MLELIGASIGIALHLARVISKSTVANSLQLEFIRVACWAPFIFGVINENRRSDVHGVHETEAFLHGAFADELRDGVGDIEVITTVGRFKPEMFSERFHGHGCCLASYKRTEAWKFQMTSRWTVDRRYCPASFC
jgi:hypothetical protein